MRFLCRVVCFTLVVSIAANGKSNGNVLLESERYESEQSVEERALTLTPAVSSAIAASLQHLSSALHHLNLTALKHLNLTTLGRLSPVTLHGNATSVPAYKTMYTSHTIHTTCPSQNLVCCKDYLLLADNCVPLSEIPNIKDDLIKLHNANIPVGK